MRQTISSSLLLLTLAASACIAGCTTSPRTVPQVTRMGDGVFKAPDAKDAEAYCRNFGEPTRFMGGSATPRPGVEVVFRCD
ncbi:MAG: hypothetical protein ABWZ88_08595 [Variovorax sp.]